MGTLNIPKPYTLNWEVPNIDRPSFPKTPSKSAILEIWDTAAPRASYVALSGSIHHKSP